MDLTNHFLHRIQLHLTYPTWQINVAWVMHICEHVIILVLRQSVDLVVLKFVVKTGKKCVLRDSNVYRLSRHCLNFIIKINFTFKLYKLIYYIWRECFNVVLIEYMLQYSHNLLKLYSFFTVVFTVLYNICFYIL